jgi:hypothetical protein
MTKTIALLLALLGLPLSLVVAGPAEWVAKTAAYARCVGSGGTTNTSTSGAGTDFVHSLACTFDPLVTPLKLNGVVSACALLSLATASTAPPLQIKLKACTVAGCGSGTVTTLVAQAAFDPATSQTSNGWICFKTVIDAAPGVSVNTENSFVTTPAGLTSAAESNNIPQPIPLNTLVAQTWTVTTQWLNTAGTGSSATLNAFVVTITN